MQMSEKMIVRLTEQAPAARWGSVNLSFDNDGALVHLSESETLKNVQKAAEREPLEQNFKKLKKISDFTVSFLKDLFLQDLPGVYVGFLYISVGPLRKVAELQEAHFSEVSGAGAGAAGKSLRKYWI